MLTAPLVLAAALATAPAAERLSQCLALVEADAEAGYEEARVWVSEQGARDAFRCAAAAELARGRPERGAAQLERLAREAPADEAAGLYSQAGNAWLIAANPDRARAAFDRAVALAPKEPDFLIDRARARALAEDWWRAEEDLSLALDLRPDDTLALALRAETRLRQGAFDLALRDAERASNLAPESVDAALSAGRAREAKRLGRLPE